MKGKKLTQIALMLNMLVGTKREMIYLKQTSFDSGQPIDKKQQKQLTSAVVSFSLYSRYDNNKFVR